MREAMLRRGRPSRPPAHPKIDILRAMLLIVKTLMVVAGVRSGLHGIRGLMRWWPLLTRCATR